MNFQKIQKISSVVPLVSTIFVTIVTMLELKRNKAPVKIWIYFLLTFFLTGIAVYFVNAVIMTGENPVLNFLVSGLLLAAANILFVDYQVMSQKSNEDGTRKKSVSRNVTPAMIIVGCVVLAVGSIIFGMLPLLAIQHIEDTNGEVNTCVATIERQEILEDASYCASGIFTSRVGTMTDVSRPLQDYDYQKCVVECKKLSGVMTLQASKTTSDRLELRINSVLKAGNMEIVIVVDGEYYENIPINRNETIVLDGIADKLVLVRIAAESAAMEASVERVERK